MRIKSERLKEIFHSASDVEIINEELDMVQFSRLMLSPDIQKAFQELLTDIRRRFKYNDFSMVDPEIGFLPTDLRLLLGYLYKRSIRQ